MRGDGDGWATSPDGSRHWGKHGAAGLLLRAPAADGSPTVLLQHRAAWSHQGGTWALPGGARDSHESTTHAAVREAEEETGIEGHAIVVRAEVVTMRVDGGWSYTTVIADADRQLETVPNRESTDLRWVREDQVTALPLHPGFAEAWTNLQATLLRVVRDSVDELLPRTVPLPEGGFGWLSELEHPDADEVDAGTVRGWLAADSHDEAGTEKTSY